MTHFGVVFDLRGGTGGAERIAAICDDVNDGLMDGKETAGFLARGGAGGRFRSDDDDMFDRVSSFELLLLLLKNV